MYFHDDIIITKKGLRIQSKALNPVGISDKSICWGIAIAPPPNNNEDSIPDLLISEFHPRSWHALFRLKIELEDDRGALLRALKALNVKKQNNSYEEDALNILSIQCARSGYRHATLNIIGEAITKSESMTKVIDDVAGKFDRNKSAFDEKNDKFRLALTRNVTYEMLKYRQHIENKIIEKNKESHFLFKSQDNNTLLYWFDDGEPQKEQHIKGELKKLKEMFEVFRESLPKTVQVRWLKYLATYRIYNQIKRQKEASKENHFLTSWKEPIRFKYDAKTAFLEPISATDKKKYKKIIEKCVFDIEVEQKKDFPIRAVGAFNKDEHYVRVFLPHREKKNNRLSIELDYSVDIEEFQNISDNRFESVCSIGLLEKIIERMSKRVNLKYISNSIQNFSNSSEKGKIFILGTTDEIPPTNELKNSIIKELKEIDEQRENIEFETPIVGRYGAKRLFISCKFDFIDKFKPAFRSKLEKIVMENGFLPVYGDPQLTRDESDGELNQLESSVTARIKSSQAFLQIIPKQLIEETIQDWLLYEYGVASGAGIPYALCVDDSKKHVYPNKVGDGKPKFTFDSCKDSEDILKEVQKAVVHLAGRVYDAG